MPAKRLTEAKSRLGRDDLTLPFLSDVVQALHESTLIDQVSIISSDLVIENFVQELGCSIIPEGAGGPGGLTSAIESGIQWCTSNNIERVLVVLGDLPCLSSKHVDAFLSLGEHNASSFLADAEGTGSTMWMRSTRSAPNPRFGVRSRAAHRESGAVEIQGDDFAGARRDVDTQVNLWDAVRIGVGTATHSALTGPLEETVVTISGIDPITAVDESGRTLELNESQSAAIPRPRIGQRLVVHRLASTRTSQSLDQ